MERHLNLDEGPPYSLDRTYSWVSGGPLLGQTSVPKVHGVRTTETLNPAQQEECRLLEEAATTVRLILRTGVFRFLPHVSWLDQGIS